MLRTKPHYSSGGAKRDRDPCDETTCDGVLRLLVVLKPQSDIVSNAQQQAAGETRVNPCPDCHAPFHQRVIQLTVDRRIRRGLAPLVFFGPPHFERWSTTDQPPRITVVFFFS